jgi:hypothetical protein
MMEVIAFKADHLKELVEQEAQEYLQAYITEDHIKEVEKSKFAFTAKSKGRVVACGGVAELWSGRGAAWAFLDSDCKKEFYAIHLAAKRLLGICPIKRIEATVDIGFKNGHRWVKSLGFILEAPILKAYMPNGGDSSLYVRLN